MNEYQTVRAIYLDGKRIPGGVDHVSIDDRRAIWLLHNGAIRPMTGNGAALQTATASTSNVSPRARVGGCGGCGWR